MRWDETQYMGHARYVLRHMHDVLVPCTYSERWSTMNSIYIYIDINNRNWYSKHDYYLSSPHRIFKLTDLLIHRTFSCMFLTWLTFWFRRNEDGHVRWKKWIWKIIISYCHPLLTQRIRFRIGQCSFQWIKWIFNNRTNLMGLSLYFQCIQMFYLKKRTREHACIHRVHFFLLLNTESNKKHVQQKANKR